MTESLYDKLGGFSMLRKVVLDFYNRVLDDPDLSPFFAEVKMAALVDHQTKFLASLLGGPASYTDQELHNIHASMAIGSRHFDSIVEILGETLEGHGVEQQHIDQVRSALLVRKAYLVRDE